MWISIASKHELYYFFKKLQKKINDGTIVEKVFVKEHNEICYFAEISILYTFINHLIYQGPF